MARVAPPEMPQLMHRLVEGSDFELPNGNEPTKKMESKTNLQTKSICDECRYNPYVSLLILLVVGVELLSTSTIKHLVPQIIDPLSAGTKDTSLGKLSY